MTTIFLLFFVLFLDNASVAQCDYTVKLYDHHHDGWSGNSLMVRVNNVNVADITLANGGGPYNYTIAAQPNDVISLFSNATAIGTPNVVTNCTTPTMY